MKYIESYINIILIMLALAAPIFLMIGYDKQSAIETARYGQ